jgi:hypothetical protein
MWRCEGHAGSQLLETLHPLGKEERSQGDADDSQGHEQLPSQFSRAQQVRHTQSQAEGQRKEQQRGDATEYGVAGREERPETEQGTQRDQQRHRRTQERQNPDAKQ